MPSVQPPRTHTHALEHSQETRGGQGEESPETCICAGCGLLNACPRQRQWRQAVGENERTPGPGEVRGRREKWQGMATRGARHPGALAGMFQETWGMEREGGVRGLAWADSTWQRGPCVQPSLELTHA